MCHLLVPHKVCMGGGELANIMSINNAVWHKKCVLKVNPTEVERARKRHISTAKQPSPVKTRRLSFAAQEKDPPFQDEPTSHIKSTNIQLLAVPDLQEVRRGTGLSVDLAFDSNITTALEMLTEQTCADEMRDLYKAAKILRKHILSTKNSFGGHFTHQSAVQSVPPILMAFMQMTLDGPAIIQGKEPPKGVSSATLSLSQLVTYNTVKRRLGPIDTIPRHIRERETPLAIYIAVKLWSVKRSESLIQTLHELGLCISPFDLLTSSSSWYIVQMFDLYQMMHKHHHLIKIYHKMTITLCNICFQ